MRILAGALVALVLMAGAAEAGCLASWYGGRHHGRLTASGARFDQRALTAAHRSLPFGTRVRVCRTSLLNPQRTACVVVRITDRGPARWTGRCIDLSRGAAERLGMIRRGVARVDLHIID